MRVMAPGKKNQLLAKGFQTIREHARLVRGARRVAAAFEADLKQAETGKLLSSQF